MFRLISPAAKTPAWFLEGQYNGQMKVFHWLVQILLLTLVTVVIITVPKVDRLMTPPPHHAQPLVVHPTPLEKRSSMEIMLWSKNPLYSDHSWFISVVDRNELGPV